MPVDVSLSEMNKFCYSIVCEGNTESLRSVEAKYPTRSFYYEKTGSWGVVYLLIEGE